MGAQRPDPSLERVMARLDALEQEVALLRQENARLRGASPARRDVAEHGGAPTSTAPRAVRTSRRGMLKALGVTMSAGTATLAFQREPAAASNGNSVTAGGITTAERRTSVTYDGPSGFGGVILLGNDNKVYDGSSASYPAGIGGWAGAGATAGPGGVANGVYGYTDNGNGNGVVGVNSNLVAGTGNGVLGTATSAAGAGVKGTNSLGTAIYGSSDSTAGSATAIIGILTSTAPGSFSSAVRGQNNGTSGLGIGVWGSQAGSGWGGYFTSNGGIGVNAAGGTGTGVNASGATGITALGDTIGVAASSTGGRGGIFAGKAAQVQLTPGSAATHPTSGAAGDLYVDSTARLWFCKGGTTWVELAATTTVAIAAGWNLVSIASGSAGLMASQFLSSLLTATGGQLAALYGLTNGQWSPSFIAQNGHTIGTDFPLAAGQGYLLYSDRAITSFTPQASVRASGATPSSPSSGAAPAIGTLPPLPLR